MASKSLYNSSQIYEILEEEITSLKITPGEYISEIDISKRFGVSRTPIRDVFKKLEYNSLIKVIPQKGTVITTIDLSRISEYMFGREAVEMAIMKEVIKNATPYHVVKLEMSLMAQLKIINHETMPLPEKAKAFFKLDNDFHKELFNFADKTTLWDLFGLKSPDYKRFRAVVAENSNLKYLQGLYKQHEEILACIQDKEINKITDVYKTHIYSGMDLISGILKKNQSYFLV